MMEHVKNHPLYKVHTIDSAMNSLWNFYKKKFLSLFIISLAMGLVLQFLSSLIRIPELQSMTNIDEIMLKIKDYLWPILIIVILSLFFTTVLHFYVIYNPLHNINVFTSIWKSAGYFIPYLIIMILFAFAGSFALVLGLFLLIVGVLFAAVYLLTIYLFILPVMLVEGPSIANTLSRTVTLSHKNFWSNLGWTTIFIIVILVITTILSAITLLPFTGNFLKAFTNPAEATTLIEITTKPLYIILSSVLNAITLPLLPIFACILYFNGIAREESLTGWLSQDNEDERKVRVEDLYARPISDEEEVKP